MNVRFQAYKIFSLNFLIKKQILIGFSYIEIISHLFDIFVDDINR